MKDEKDSAQGLDNLDIAILRELQKDCRTSVQIIAKKVKTPSSTVHYRIKRLEEQEYINGYYVNLNPGKVGKDYITIMQVRAEYKQNYHEDIGKKLAKLPGVSAVYFLLGEWDFIVLFRSKDQVEYMQILEQVMKMEGIERTSTLVVARVLKEDSRIKL
ncbi:MAG: Lrp/AsnC family transcriptional regulator [Candidatus Hodarchaeales archaeon]|jgi:DNA-binding Lrp family transcriptional regulator